MEKPLVGIVMGSDSDLPIMKDAAVILEELGLSYEMTIISAHRTPERAEEYARTAAERGIKVIIAGAGKAAHLAGVLAAYTPLPVIGVPILTSSLGGADSLYSMVQMPKGVPVAVVALNGAFNAGILAAQMIGTGNLKIREAIECYKEEMKAKVNEKARKLERIGYEAYLEEVK
ncbi:5-(carboxyamino)imidazole ribonucleotide mutase [Anoxybacter fermentans]|uniref:N5-carboxyaminoimidazole ribonucleotide mutase n=1 Tax=Anoxybacter fermentans TaxID=1323375 RepID=A0A3S9T129_9FIRM|nr:5-(carboxyamino)imidazole ribonucleotide mutase [Anoxybacter fermentans]AZR74249.1 5-(carboxyamino)imidazole ribonucleotide mutase [Anoxybacter fermentans]